MLEQCIVGMTFQAELTGWVLSIFMDMVSK